VQASSHYTAKKNERRPLLTSLVLKITNGFHAPSKAAKGAHFTGEY